MEECLFWQPCIISIIKNKLPIYKFERIRSFLRTSNLNHFSPTKSCLLEGNRRYHHGNLCQTLDIQRRRSLWSNVWSNGRYNNVKSVIIIEQQWWGVEDVGCHVQTHQEENLVQSSFQKHNCHNSFSLGIGKLKMKKITASIVSQEREIDFSPD